MKSIMQNLAPAQAPVSLREFYLQRILFLNIKTIKKIVGKLELLNIKSIKKVSTLNRESLEYALSLDDRYFVELLKFDTRHINYISLTE